MRTEEQQPMRQLQIITAQPNDSYFVWQLRVQLHNFRKYGYSKLARILVFKHNDRRDKEDFMDQWKNLERDYPEAQFFYYEDPAGDLLRLIQKYDYIPLLRPWLLSKHFKEYPELKEDAILYMDSDVVFTKYLDFQPFVEDDICYLSDTSSYISGQYFDSKVKDVLPDKLDNYKIVDVLATAAGMFSVTREHAIANNDNSGGAQYLLKGMDSQFWEDVLVGCIKIKTYLRGINRRFFENEDKGFQSWCADMWSVLWNLWRNKKVTKCPRELDFAWATDDISKWDRVYLYHDAGASTKPVKDGHILFHKRDLPYVNNDKTPFEDNLDYVSDEYCSKNYVREIQGAGAEIWAKRTLVENEAYMSKKLNDAHTNFLLWGRSEKINIDEVIPSSPHMIKHL